MQNQTLLELEIMCICGDPECQIPYGECHCGCGGKAPIAKKGNKTAKAGKPQRYIQGHSHLRTPGYDWIKPNTNDGYCMCGCGEKTPIATSNDYRRGSCKGEYRQYLPGHNNRKGMPLEKYIEEDRGYKTPCWIWQSDGQSNRPYGSAHMDGIAYPAHRYFYESIVGPIPDGLVLDHLCRITLCVNPDHLEPVTSAINNRRGMQTKFTQEDVNTIRTLIGQGKNISELAVIYNVARATIRNIRNNVTWHDPQYIPPSPNDKIRNSLADVVIDNQTKEKYIKNVTEEYGGWRTPCWRYEGIAYNKEGYLSYYVIDRRTNKRKYFTLHRLIFEIYRGPLDKILDLDHLCRNKWCVNPNHLEPVTSRENTLRATDLSWEVVGEIRKIFKKGVTIRAIADKYDLKEDRVGQICRGQTWKETA